MLRQSIILAGLCLFSQAAFAAEAGKVIFAAGTAKVADVQAKEGLAVQEGALLQTEGDGFIYVKTVDNGLLILRPNTKARIATYQVDTAHPENTKVKLELLNGVARARSGDAVKQARQNFRFNTPVAAIGVRGTDFTVSTDNDTTRVTVMSGGVVVSPFGGACAPEGTGPCEGSATRELFAAQRGKMLQVQRGKAAPDLMQGGQTPDDVAPARSDEPLKSAGVILDGKKGDSLKLVSQNLPTNGGGNNNPPPTIPETPQVVVGEKSVIWGRWQWMNGNAPSVDLVEAKKKADVIAVNGNFALLRSTEGKDYVAPERGNVGFNLASSEAYLTEQYGPIQRIYDASVSNGKLNVDFGNKSFATSMDVTARNERFSLQASGTISSDGRMFGDGSNGKAGYMDVQGLLSNENGGSAAYLFNSRVDDRRTLNGVTYWKR